MKALINSYLDILLNQRHWSWTLVVIVYVIVGLWIRSLFLKPLVRRAKSLDRKYYHDVKSVYLKRSIPGWISFAISVALVIGLWLCPLSFPLTWKQVLALVALVICYGFSILQHLTALGVGSLLTLRSVLGLKDEF